MFLNRLTLFSMKGGNQLGFIPDISKLLYKYGLSHVLEFLKVIMFFLENFLEKKKLNLKFRSMNYCSGMSNLLSRNSIVLNVYIIHS